MYQVEVSKLVGPSWLFLLSKDVEGMGQSRDFSHPRSAGVQDNLEGIHAISRPVCESLHNIAGGFLSLPLA